MAGTDERRKNPIGRRAADLQVHLQKIEKALQEASSANALAHDALTRIDKHTALCEQQNITILEKLNTQKEWRKEDLAFQRKVMIGLIVMGFGAMGTVAMVLVGVVLKALRLN